MFDRIATVTMRPMSLFEAGASTGAVHVGDLVLSPRHAASGVGTGEDSVPATADTSTPPRADVDDDDDEGDQDAAPVTVMGDSAYADGATLSKLTDAGHEVIAKVPPARNTRGGFTKDQFQLDLEEQSATCPAGTSAPITPVGTGGGVVRFGSACADCPLRAACTSAKNGRVITIHPHEAALQKAKTAQKDPHWQARYRSQRPIVERKISHFVRKPWGGRKARTRGSARILTDVIARAAAINLARLAALDVHFTPTGWETSSPAI